MVKNRSVSVKSLKSTARTICGIKDAIGGNGLIRHKTTLSLRRKLSVRRSVANATPSRSMLSRFDIGRSSITTPRDHAADLEERLGREVRLREAAHQLRMEHDGGKDSDATIQANKNMLLSDLRLAAYKNELDKRKTRSVEMPLNASNGRLAVSEIRIPLMWKEQDHFRNRGDARQFAVFVVVRVGCEICDTGLVTGVDRTSTDLVFRDVCLFEKVPPNFQLIVEVYSTLLSSSFNGASSLKMRKLSKGSFSRSLGQKLGSAIRGQLSTPPSDMFNLIATAKLTVRDAGTVKAHDLFLNKTANKKDSLPIYDHFCCQLSVMPQSFHTPLIEDTINIEVAGRVFQKYWCRLGKGELCGWRSKAESQQSPFIKILFNTRCVCQISRNGLNLILSVPSHDTGYSQYMLTPRNAQSLHKFMHFINIQINDVNFWGEHATVQNWNINEQNGLQEINNNNLNKRNPRKNLYEQISIMGSPKLQNKQFNENYEPMVIDEGTCKKKMGDLKKKRRSRSLSAFIRRKLN